MSQYFFNISQAEKNNILNQHKTIYDGYVTQFGQQSNTQPLYVQDFANDKGGITVSNKGDVKQYTNIGINESHSMLDMIGDGPDDLENGTVNLDDDFNIEDEDIFGFDDELYEEDEVEFEFDDEVPLDVINDVPDDLKEEFTTRLGESLSMFKRIIK